MLGVRACGCRHDARGATRRGAGSPVRVRDARADDGRYRRRQLPRVRHARRRHVRHQDRHHPTDPRRRTHGHHRRRTAGAISPLTPHPLFLYSALMGKFRLSSFRGLVAADSRIRHPACSYCSASVHCLTTIYVEAIRVDSHAPVRATHMM